MFTIRFVQHTDPKDYKSFSAITYQTIRNKNCAPAQTKITMELAPNGEREYTEYVGDNEPYAAAYVTNQAGKTIDVIRAE